MRTSCVYWRPLEATGCQSVAHISGLLLVTTRPFPKVKPASRACRLGLSSFYITATVSRLRVAIQAKFNMVHVYVGVSLFMPRISDCKPGQYCLSADTWTRPAEGEEHVTKCNPVSMLKFYGGIIGCRRRILKGYYEIIKCDIWLFRCVRVESYSDVLVVSG